MDSASRGSSTDGDGAGAVVADEPCAIKVVVRARPLNEKEVQAKTPIIVNVSRESIQVVNPIVFADPSYLEAASSPGGRRPSVSDLPPIALSPAATAAANAIGECRTFHFDRCFGASLPEGVDAAEVAAGSYDVDSTTQRPNQELIFDEIGQDLIASAFQGFNCTLLAYGQTGSGKTHTMVGDKTPAGKGVIPRVCEALFLEVEARRAKEAERDEAGGDSPATGGEKETGRTIYSAHVSYCEIYKEKVNDLLDSEAPSSATEKRRPSLTSPFQASSDEATASASSSRRALRVREHPITGPFVEGLSSHSVASYADIAEEMLAGEKLRTVASTLMNAVSSRSHAVFTITFTQTAFDPVSQCANDKVLTYCRPVVLNTHVLLADVRRVHCWWNYDETMSTLRYAESAKKVMNRAVVNEDKNARIIRQLRQEIEDLRAQLATTRLSPRKGSSSAGLSASLMERESFYSQLQQEVESSRSQQKQMTISTVEAVNAPFSVIHLDGSLPSLVNMNVNMTAGEALAYLLIDGATLFGSDPEPDEVQKETAKEQAGADLGEFEAKGVAESGSTEQSAVPQKKRRSSWSPTFLRRRSSPSAASPTRAASRSPALTVYKRSGTQVCRLQSPDGSDVLPRHARFLCSYTPLTPLALEDTPKSEGEATEYTVEVEPLDPNAVVLVNGQQLEFGEIPATKLSHGDQIQLGRGYFFRLHGRIPLPGSSMVVPRIAQAVQQPLELEPRKDEGRELEELVDEANAICTKWLLNTEFAVAKESIDVNEAVVVKKKLDADCYSTVHWDRAALETKLQLLREFAASLETVASITMGVEASQVQASDPVEAAVEVAIEVATEVEAEAAAKVAVSRAPNRPSDRTSQVEIDSPRAKSGTSGHAPSSSAQSTPSVRLLGHGRIHLAAQPPGSTVALTVAIYDFSGVYLGKLDTRLTGTSPAEPAKKKAGMLGLFSPKGASNSTRAIQIHVDKMELEADCLVTAGSISITLKEASKKVVSSDETSSPSTFSTAQVPPMEGLEASDSEVERTRHTFLLGETFETTVKEKKRSSESLFSGDKDSLLVEVWGYDVTRTASALQRPQQVEFYVSVDVEERDHDALYRAVSVKPDGALRLHVKRARRLLVRVTQSDRQSFGLSDIVRVCIAPPASQTVDEAASRSTLTGKTSQRVLSPSPPVEFDRPDDSPAVHTGGKTSWQVLDFRGDRGIDESSRSLSATLKWDQLSASDVEHVNPEGERSVFRLAIAFTTRWSSVPVVVSKSLVTKMCPSNISATQKWARGLESSRTAWWAKESFSRNFRLGTWYVADITSEPTAAPEGSANANEIDGEERSDPPKDEATPSATSVTEEVMDGHIGGLNRLAMVMQLERMRQKVWIMLNLRLSAPSFGDGGGASDTRDEVLTVSMVDDCLDELSGGEERAFESVQLASCLCLRPQKRKDLLMDLSTGQLVDQDAKSCSSSGQTHAIHFVSEPTQLVGGAQLEGEMSGFLMLSLSLPLDEATAAAVIAPLGGTKAGTKAALAKASSHRASKASWERHWFVLKRPFLYVYENFARNQQTGIMDLSMCQLLVSSASTSDLPFSFRLVSLDGRKQAAVWWLQASTAAEMRAWLVALDPLKIEARQAVASTPSSAETPALTA
ncbi:hypothetical protein BBJ28_00012719 [Nothophytophthora sp. Chile5]|nr:hypothetical protein BBJ28_00012719 [Nothophytophthora sp. Chile5]